MWLLRLAGYELYCGYAYVGFSSVLDGPILVYGLTGDKAVLRSTLAREQWRTEERAMEWAMLLWLSQVFKSIPGIFRVKLMARLPILESPPRRHKTKSSVGNSSRRRKSVAYVGYRVCHAGRPSYCFMGRTDAKVELARCYEYGIRCYKYGIRTPESDYHPGKPEHAERKSEPKWPGYR
ncbi:hypothetical protein V8C40DRAFT_108578 [Trichoderma camerunense]